MKGETCSCCTCGYEWLWGQDGSHSCARTLLGVIRDLKAAERRRQIELLVTFIDAGYQAVCAEEADAEVTKAVEAKLRELRAEEGPRHLLIIGKHVKEPIGCMSNPGSGDIAHAQREDPGCSFVEVSPGECPICTREDG